MKYCHATSIKRHSVSRTIFKIALDHKNGNHQMRIQCLELRTTDALILSVSKTKTLKLQAFYAIVRERNHHVRINHAVASLYIL